MSGYTVIDLETTGLSPQRSDRIVELGVVYVSSTGQIQDEWGTLINPQRDMGATEIHGIKASDVLEAPTFAEVAPYLMRALAGRVIVAHNARFDLAFLEAEFRRLGAQMGPNPPCVCTMEWSARYVSGSSRKLGACCAAAGLQVTSAHSALGDAHAVAELLSFFLQKSHGRPGWQQTLVDAPRHGWPTYTGAMPKIHMCPRQAHEPPPDSWLDRVTSTMPRIENPATEAYVDVLERALLDGYLSAHEKRDLVEVARQFGLQRHDLAAIHTAYFKALATIAWADDVVTLDEQMQLSQVAAALGIPMHEPRRSLKRLRARRPHSNCRICNSREEIEWSSPGELSMPRDSWVERIAVLGMTHGTITKATRVVVAADPDSLSGKQKDARLRHPNNEQVFRTLMKRGDRKPIGPPGSKRYLI